MLGKQHEFPCKNYVEIGAIELGSVQSQFCLFNQFLISEQVNLMHYAWGCFLLYFITAAENLKQLAFHVFPVSFCVVFPTMGLLLLSCMLKLIKFVSLFARQKLAVNSRSCSGALLCTFCLISANAAAQGSAPGFLPCLRASADVLSFGNFTWISTPNSVSLLLSKLSEGTSTL